MKTMMAVVVMLMVSLATPAMAQTNTDDLLNTVDGKLLKKLQSETKGDRAQLYQKLGFSYFKQQEFDRAFLYFHAAIQLNPKLYWSWYYLGLLNLQDPETYFKKAIEAEPRFAPAYYWLARTYEKQGKKADAIKCFNDYIKVAGNDPQEAKRIDEAKYMLIKLKGGA